MVYVVVVGYGKVINLEFAVGGVTAADEFYPVGTRGAGGKGRGLPTVGRRKGVGRVG